MTGVRVYVPTTMNRLAAVVAAGGVGPAPFVGHAVTAALQDAWPEAGEEEWEYAALTAAAHEAIGLLTDEDQPRRVVIALDAPGVLPLDQGDPTQVQVAEVVPLRRVASVHVDSVEAADDVEQAREAWARAEAGDEAAGAVVERCSEHELEWYAVQEIGALLQS